VGRQQGEAAGLSRRSLIGGAGATVAGGALGVTFGGGVANAAPPGTLALKSVPHRARLVD
jgi:hypothetical protein